ncbi:MAG: hypothetical protein JXJ04_24305 [Spirochaetales bacterium]|nr:hypothetical protein [Spirochaetales bacterium]
METTMTSTRHMPNISLLWPPESLSSPWKTYYIDEQTFDNLELSYIISDLALKPQYRAGVERIIRNVPVDPKVIIYRQEIFEDLHQSPELVAVIEELIPVFDIFLQYRKSKRDENSQIFELAARLSELEGYIFCIRKFHEAFGKITRDFKSEGIKAFKAAIEQTTDDEMYQNLVEELPGLLTDIRGIHSVSIGVNLSSDLIPVEATLLSVNKTRYRGPSSMIKQIFKNNVHDDEGIAKLHSSPVRELYTHSAKFTLDPGIYGYAVNPILVPLFRDLSELIAKTSKPIIKELKKYISIKTHVFSGLKDDFIFYLGALKMTERIKSAGLPMCKPLIHPSEERRCDIKESFNINLALHLLHTRDMGNPGEVVVKNDVHLGPGGRIIILTGPNRGGKTTYTQGIGLAQILAQGGLYVPGSEAQISPADGVFSHFPIEEKIDKGTGRLGDEARRLYEILSLVTGNSLLLLNESFSSTSAGESFFIARDIVRILRSVGARVVFATHLHELGFAVDEINSSIDGTSKVMSMISLVDEKDKNKNEVIRTFRIVPGKPDGQSYALEIATKYGIGFDQLKKLFSQRGIL